jgi:hypothetical protein
MSHVCVVPILDGNLAIPAEAIRSMFSDLHDTEYACLMYAMGCARHRIIKFGWEPQINNFPPRLIFLLACRVGTAPLSVRLYEEAMRRYWEENGKDPSELEFKEVTVKVGDPLRLRIEAGVAACAK